jgi:hypothetical protein
VAYVGVRVTIGVDASRPATLDGYCEQRPHRSHAEGSFASTISGRVFSHLGNYLRRLQLLAPRVAGASRVVFTRDQLPLRRLSREPGRFFYFNGRDGVAGRLLRVRRWRRMHR